MVSKEKQCFHDLIFCRVQLAVCISNIVKHDFPGRWTQIVDKITIYLQNPDASCWPGVLLALYQFVKNFELVFLLILLNFFIKVLIE